MHPCKPRRLVTAFTDRRKEHVPDVAATMYDASHSGTDFMALAESMGVPAQRIDRAADIAPALEAAIASGVPNLIEMISSA